ncbi:hypothetical protein GIB67_013103 [Kingdonia uniflora]|uniref:Uncharacterized protein n=1 Tax=Kingdonia uniflora TaxID=39325 RepID=A0A7J7NNE5_9MAGN|nr:hypothetical protein GIB67_013103 [Kingdonia uniflora]
MKNKASMFLKQVISMLKNKARAMKTRLVILSLLKNKRLLIGSISNKIHALLGQEHKEDVGDQSNAIVIYNAMVNDSNANPSCTHEVLEEDDEGDDNYPDLRHSLFDSDGDDYDDQTGSVIDIVRNSKEEEGEDFILEEEIDHVADLFIRRFHRQMKLQKQESFKRYQDMLDRSV